MDATYDQYESGETQSYDSVELRITPYTTIEVEVDAAFGTDSDYGQSFGVNLTDVTLQDGVVLVNPKGDGDNVYKVFSWKDVYGRSASETLERGDELTADEAPEVETRTYFGDTYTYELVAARVPEITDEDGDVVLEASSLYRPHEISGDGSIDFEETQDLGGEPVDLPDAVSWYNGNSDYGPSTTASVMARTLSEMGEDVIADDEDLFGWLADTSGDNLLRADLEDRRVQIFQVRRDGDEYSYNLPIIVDVKTGEQIQPSERGDSGNDDSGLESAREADAGSQPEPIAEFISSGRNLNLNEKRANGLLDELVGDTDSPLTGEMVDDFGGREALVEQVT